VLGALKPLGDTVKRQVQSVKNPCRHFSPRELFGVLSCLRSRALGLAGTRQLQHRRDEGFVTLRIDRDAPFTDRLWRTATVRADTWQPTGGGLDVDDAKRLVERRHHETRCVLEEFLEALTILSVVRGQPPITDNPVCSQRWMVPDHVESRLWNARANLSEGS